MDLRSTTEVVSTPRTATLDELLKTIVPLFVNPPPTKETLRAWFEKAKIPCCKNNPMAKRGGGPIYYNVSAVEKFFRRRMGQ